MKQSFYIHTLGCKVNQYNSQIIRENFIHSGLKEEEYGSIQIVNGCMVTKKAERKTRKLIYSSLRKGEKVLVTGCYGRKKIPLKGVVSLPEERELIKYVTGREQSLKSISSFHSHTRAFVKIQQGCSYSCSYCIVPKVRGEVYSRKVEEILREVECLSPFYPELVISGTHLGLYNDGEGADLASLVEEMLKRVQFSRIRFSSLEINEITPELLTLFHHPRLCPHLHIPLQSGSDRILKLMRRLYTKKVFLKKIEKIKRKFPDMAFTTDIMVGFPTEDDEDFLETLDAVEKVGFLRIHIFPYSIREGTDAVSLTPQVEESVKKERERVLHDTAILSSLNFRRKFIGAKKTIIVEDKQKNGRRWGYSEDYIQISIGNNREAVPGISYTVTVTKVDKNSTEGILIKKGEFYKNGGIREKRRLLSVC
ncbi:MAG TPA: MiaB/RimO family radical SAM methylthiotransferase [Candidatus Omnitrophica bacterium]|nr:MiaB/RimO family radical SAM methylthiotransferase [Candidatus Omnitrophota bacterium]